MSGRPLKSFVSIAEAVVNTLSIQPMVSTPHPNSA